MRAAVEVPTPLFKGGCFLEVLEGDLSCAVRAGE